jgi:hypothetical protein
MHESYVQASSVVEVPFEAFDLRCLGSGKEYVIRSQEAYQQLIDNSPDLHPEPFLPCIDYTFPRVDFSEVTLLGQGVQGGGCSMGIEKRLLRDDLNKEYLFTVTATQHGTCEIAFTRLIWVAVRDMQADYAVRFQLEKKGGWAD